MIINLFCDKTKRIEIPRKSRILVGDFLTFLSPEYYCDVATAWRAWRGTLAWRPGPCHNYFSSRPCTKYRVKAVGSVDRCRHVKSNIPSLPSWQPPAQGLPSKLLDETGARHPRSAAVSAQHCRFQGLTTNDQS